MIEVELVIGGRTFVIACEENEQEKVKKAAELINNEAEEIQAQLGRLPESKMLLLSALMIADRVIEVEVEMKTLKRTIENLESSLRNYKEGEDINSIEKINSLKMEGLVEKILLNLENFLNEVSVSDRVNKNETVNESNNIDNNQPKLF